MNQLFLRSTVLTALSLVATLATPLSPVHATDDVPDGAPPAAHRSEPKLATPC